MHVLHKFKQVYCFDFLFIMQLLGTLSKLVTFVLSYFAFLYYLYNIPVV